MIREIIIDHYPLNAQEVIESFYQYNNDFFFCYDGVRSVIKKGFEISLRATSEYNPPTLCEFEGLLGEVIKDYELFIDRNPAVEIRNPYITTTDFLFQIELIVDKIEQQIDQFIRTYLPAAQCEITNPRWHGDQLFIRMKINKNGN